MSHKILHLFVFLLMIFSLHGEDIYVCDLCNCDQIEHPIIVHCDSKNLTTLTNIFFNSTIETLTFINNSLTFKSDDDLHSINNLTSLKHLDLSENPLEILPSFSLNELISVRLEKTSLKSILFPESYRNSSKLQTIVLSHNEFHQIHAEDFKSFPSLSELFLDDAQLTSIDRNAFLSATNSLHTLSLMSNSLQSAEFLSVINNLRSINFDRNHFKDFPQEIFKQNQMKEISFRENQIEIINESSPFFYWMKSNISDLNVYLYQNPIDCCKSQWFITYLNSQNNLVKDFNNLTCASPKNYQGQRLIDLHVDLLNCSIDPPNKHSKKLKIALLSLTITAMGLCVVLAMYLHNRKKINFRRHRHQYEPIDGTNTPITI